MSSSLEMMTESDSDAAADEVDAIWSKLVHAIGSPNGLLATSGCRTIKVSPALDGGQDTHIICVYCDDSYDRMAIAKVAKVLAEDLELGSGLAYKVSLSFATIRM